MFLLVRANKTALSNIFLCKDVFNIHSVFLDSPFIDKSSVKSSNIIGVGFDIYLITYLSILYFDINFNIINRFDSISDAIKYIKNSISPNLTLVGIRKGLSRHCTDETKKLLYKGFVWKYDR